LLPEKNPRQNSLALAWSCPSRWCSGDLFVEVLLAVVTSGGFKAAAGSLTSFSCAQQSGGQYADPCNCTGHRRGCGDAGHGRRDDYDGGQRRQRRGAAYFGFVRDARGSPVAEAQVVLQPKKGKPMSLKSNVLGLYRGHISKEVMPDEVQGFLREDGLQADQGQPPHAARQHGDVRRD